MQKVLSQVTGVMSGVKLPNGRLTPQSNGNWEGLGESKGFL